MWRAGFFKSALILLSVFVFLGCKQKDELYLSEVNTNAIYYFTQNEVRFYVFPSTNSNYSLICGYEGSNVKVISNAGYEQTLYALVLWNQSIGYVPRESVKERKYMHWSPSDEPGDLYYISSDHILLYDFPSTNSNYIIISNCLYQSISVLYQSDGEFDEILLNNHRGFVNKKLLHKIHTSGEFPFKLSMDSGHLYIKVSNVQIQLDLVYDLSPVDIAQLYVYSKSVRPDIMIFDLGEEVEPICSIIYSFAERSELARIRRLGVSGFSPSGKYILFTAGTSSLVRFAIFSMEKKEFIYQGASYGLSEWQEGDKLTFSETTSDTPDMPALTEEERNRYTLYEREVIWQDGVVTPSTNWCKTQNAEY